MEDLLQMKGAGRTLITLLRDEGAVVRLMQYADGSWSVLRDRTICGQWEAHETDDCLRAFLRQSGGLEPVMAVLFTQVQGAVGCADAVVN
jgi:hypothetical protein